MKKKDNYIIVLHLIRRPKCENNFFNVIFNFLEVSSCLEAKNFGD